MGEQDPKCRAVKHGGVTLLCTLLPDHPGWHKSTFTEESTMRYDGSLHVITRTETVHWEPVDHAAEAARHLMAGRQRDA